MLRGVSVENVKFHARRKSARRWVFLNDTCAFCSICIGVGDGDSPPFSQKIGEIYFFSGKYQVKFGHFVNVSYIYLRENVLPPKVD